MKANFNIVDDLKNRILVIDGAMGTNINKCMLNEKDYKGEVLKEFPLALKGNNDILSVTNPEIVKNIKHNYK